jgi:AraC family transcriptional activator of pobA
MNRPPIPSYDLYRGDSLALPFSFMLLDRATGSYNASEPHRHNYHEVFYFAKGGGTHDIDFRTFAIEDDSIHFVNPGQVHQVKRAEGSHGFIILFTTEFIALNRPGADQQRDMWFLSHSPPEPILKLSADEHQRFLDTIGMIREEFGSDSAYREEILRAYLDIFLLHARRRFEKSGGVAQEPGSAHDLIIRLRTLIERNFTTIHAPKGYAEMLCVSQNHLNSAVKRALGRTIGDLVHDRLVLEAQRLLYHTELSVKEIAFQLNYDDPSYFTRFFRTHAGVAPHEFRETSRKKH